MEKELPNGWVKIDLSSICSLQGGFAFKSVEYCLSDSGVPIVRMGNISKSFKMRWNLNKQQYFPTDRVNEVKKYLLNKEDLLICLTDLSNTGDYLGTVALMDDNIPSLLNQRVSRFEFDKSLFNTKFLYYLLTDSAFRRYMTSDSTGTLQQNTNHNYILNYKSSIAPFAEQRRIVAKLDKLFSNIERIKERLDNIPKLLKNFRQAVLSQAVSGKLTNCKIVESKLGDLLSDVKYGTSKKSEYHINGTPIFRIPNIRNGEIDDKDLKFSILDSKEFQQLKLKKGDILIIRSNGSPLLVGQSAIIREHHVDCSFAGYLIRLRSNENISSEYLNFALKSSSLRKQIEVTSRSTNGINNINSEEIKRLNIHHPTISEQQEIVRQVESLFAKADAIEALYKNLKENLNKLPQAILSKAFSGKLVAQNPNDEPAAELLKRIKQTQSLGKKVSKLYEENNMLSMVAED